MKLFKNKLKIALEFLKILEDSGYSAYIVGGYVRDYLLKINSNDFDIATNAHPKDVVEIFKKFKGNTDYGSITVEYKNINFEVTTFRKESGYNDHRHPSSINYVKSIEEDLKRRDFTINTLCMDKNGRIIDYYNAKDDLEKKIIRCVGSASSKFYEDSLRMLRALRFATVLNFTLDNDIKEAIIQNRYLLKDVSFDRKKEELNKIFTSKNAVYGVKLLQEFELLDLLDVNNLIDVKNFSNLLGVWAVIDSKNYNFTKTEKTIINDIKNCLKCDIEDDKVLYKYGLYIAQVVGDIKGINKCHITKRYSKLPIKKISDINISFDEIFEIVNDKKIIKLIYSDLESAILEHKLKNKNANLRKYIVDNYKKC